MNIWFAQYLLFLVHCVHGVLLPIDSNYPSIMSNAYTVKFYEGGGAFLLASNNMVRLNYRGIQYLPDAQLISGILEKGWSEYDCNVSKSSLCSMSTGAIFPSYAPRIGNSSTELSCTQSIGKQMVGEAVYDVSSCDILDEYVEIIYTPNKVYTRHSYMHILIYFIFIICCILIVRSLSLNIISKLDSSVVVVQYPTLLVIFVILLITLIQGDSYYATVNDLVFFWFTVMYVIIYLLFHGYHVYIQWRTQIHKEPRVFNLSAAAMQLVVMRLYGSAETPYAGVIIAVIATRLWEKELNRKRPHIFTGLMDCIYISLLIHIGFSYAMSYLFPLFVGCKVLAERLHSTTKTHNKTQKKI
jgi:hypothetical protein